jgi:CheY-like chemotaxis protein
MSGKELLTVIRAMPHYDDTPIILFTTSNMQQDILLCPKAWGSLFHQAYQLYST